jgi:hypothetical protein
MAGSKDPAVFVLGGRFQKRLCPCLEPSLATNHCHQALHGFPVEVRSQTMRALIFAVVSFFPAVIFGQAPEFIQQYQQRLGGTADELQLHVQHFDEDSRRSGYERSGALQLMARNPEQLVRDQSVRMTESIDRLGRLREQQVRLEQAGGIDRFAFFVSNYDRPLASRTWENYKMGFPLSLDGVLFTFFGFASSLLLLGGCSIGLGRLMKESKYPKIAQ